MGPVSRQPPPANPFSKPLTIGGFPTEGFATSFRKGPDCVAGPFRGLFLETLSIGRERGKRTNWEHPRTIPRQIGKIPLKSGKTQKGYKKGQKKEGKSREPPHLNPPRPPILEVILGPPQEAGNFAHFLRGATLTRGERHFA